MIFLNCPLIINSDQLLENAGWLAVENFILIIMITLILIMIMMLQGGTSWLAFGERKIIPQSFRRARICKFSRQKTLFFTIA